MGRMWPLEGERDIVYLRLFHIGLVVFVWLFLAIGFLFFE